MTGVIEVVGVAKLAVVHHLDGVAVGAAFGARAADAVMDPAPRSENRSLPKLKSGSTLEVAAKELTNSSYDAAAPINGIGS
jgi:hypothetical protein